MNSLRKIPLEGLIQILTNLFETGADFIDISGQQDDREDGPFDVIKITVKPEYMSDESELEIEVDIEEEGDDDDDKPSLSEDDINELI
jgi:hypothetical protein